jgi:hypothetical protein
MRPGARRQRRDRLRVPLTDAAIAVMNTMAAKRQNDFIFPGGKRGKPLSNMAMLKTMARMKRDDLTVHGFRSTFRDWAGDRTQFQGRLSRLRLRMRAGPQLLTAGAAPLAESVASRDGLSPLFLFWSGHMEIDHGEAAALTIMITIAVLSLLGPIVVAYYG